MSAFTLVLLPGLGCDEASWRDQLEALAPWSPQVSDVHMRHPTLPEMAAALLARHRGPLALCGASLGGMVALEAARQAPDRIRGLALLGTTARPETAGSRRAREQAIALFEQGRVAEVIEPNAALAFAPSRASDAGLLRRYVEAVLRAGTGQLARQNRAVLERQDARPHLAGLRCPTLVLCGHEDAFTPPECSREIAALVPRAQLVVLPHCGHLPALEQPQAVNAHLRCWLGQVDAFRPDAGQGPRAAGHRAGAGS